MSSLITRNGESIIALFIRCNALRLLHPTCGVFIAPYRAKLKVQEDG